MAHNEFGSIGATEGEIARERDLRIRVHALDFAVKVGNPHETVRLAKDFEKFLRGESS